MKAHREKYWFFRNVAEVLGEGIIVLDERGCLTFMNPEAERLLGWTEVELLGKNLHLAVHHTRADGTPCPLEECPVNKKIAAGETYRVDEEFFSRKDGTLLPVAFVSTPLVEDGWVTGSVSVFRDISAEKKAKAELLDSRERAENATKLKDRFLSLAAHDLRAPLVSLIGFLRWIERDAGNTMDAKHREMLNRAETNTEHLVEMIDGLLDIGRLTSGEIQPVNSRFSVRSATALVLEKFRHSAEEKGVALENHLPEDFEIFADYGLFLSVLYNLVSNAVKFSRPGGAVTVFSPPEFANTIAVKDTGVGVPKALLPDLFTRERKTSRPGTAGERGNGIGLPFTYEIVKSHGGALWVESDEGGSTFYVSLP